MVSIYYSPYIEKLLLISIMKNGNMVSWDSGTQFFTSLKHARETLIEFKYELIGAFYEN